VAAALLGGALGFVVYSFVGTFIFGVFIYYATRPVYRRLKQYVRPPSVAALVALLTLALPALLLLAYIFGPLLFGWYGIFLGPMLLVLVVHFVRHVLPELLASETISPTALGTDVWTAEPREQPESAEPTETDATKATAVETLIEEAEPRRSRRATEAVLRSNPTEFRVRSRRGDRTRRRRSGL
jgi:hypothetical protein